MEHTVSKDVMRRAMKKMDEATALAWLEKHNREAITPILFLPWILDIDNTVNPLYVHQERREIGYNPHKPGRLGHNYHSISSPICASASALKFCLASNTL